MDWIGIPAAAALEPAAPLVECAANTEVSIPACLNCSLIQRPIVELLTAPRALALPWSAEREHGFRIRYIQRMRLNGCYIRAAQHGSEGEERYYLPRELD
ncbi:hypothetical protein OUZ56_018292 [Daphnia magna]|uniref:Uncharacterized protein n=1 Tax=Daphnia magna TaxID=35525 RepID=A0ABQ9Z8H9_9CRUS|nr:hypothetical protein OUZ56_018292 [Daphnia magna]